MQISGQKVIQPINALAYLKKKDTTLALGQYFSIVPCAGTIKLLTIVIYAAV
jgi:hypothetical protein